MEKLTKAEEPIMKVIWSKGQALVRDIMKELNSDIPYNTISSIVRILETKGMVGYKAFGRTHLYYPLVSKVAYRKFILKTMIADYFDGSYKGLLSQLLEDDEMTKDELDELRNLIDNSHE